jgi:two-component system sensor histidine kinase PilS (NtrC family)
MEKVSEPKIIVSTAVENGVFVVKIKDFGIGMSESTQKRLFEPFFTTKHGGTGLGLATTHKILESHEARIHVESHEGRGTEFTIEFTKLAPIEQPADNIKDIKRGHG